MHLKVMNNLVGHLLTQIQFVKIEIAKNVKFIQNIHNAVQLKI